MTKTVLILGASGGFGGALARELDARGFRLAGLHRNPASVRDRADLPRSIHWREGDALSAADVLGAAHDADVIVHAVNPSRYRNWAGLVGPMSENVIAAARALGARILFPGNVYNFGEDAGEFIDERASQNPPTRKGRLRVEMERRLERAAGHGVRALVLRAGDYFGARSPSSWLETAMVKPGRPIQRVVYPGDPDVGHAWAYLPDFALAAAKLIEVEASLPAFDCYHFGGHYFERGVEFAEIIVGLAGGACRVASVPWSVVAALAPFNETLRETLEMRYLWRRSLRLNDAKLRARIGPLPQTPIAVALEATLRSLGCLRPERSLEARPIDIAALVQAGGSKFTPP